MRKIFPVFAVLAGIFWIVYAFEYGLWIRRGPGGGFFPLIGGALTIVFSALYLKNEIRNPTPAAVNVKFLYPILAVLGMLLSSYLLGMIPSMLLFIFLWLWLYEKYAVFFSACVSAGTLAVIYGVFILWLRVPLPQGVLGGAVWG